jgi:hypothetical protein
MILLFVKWSGDFVEFDEISAVPDKAHFFFASAKMFFFSFLFFRRKETCLPKRGQRGGRQAKESRLGFLSGILTSSEAGAFFCFGRKCSFFPFLFFRRKETKESRLLKLWLNSSVKNRAKTKPPRAQKAPRASWFSCALRACADFSPKNSPARIIFS